MNGILNENTPQTAPPQKSPDLRDTLNEAMQVEGAVAVALVDIRSGRCVRTSGRSAAMRLGAFAAVGAKTLYAASALNRQSGGDRVEDIVIALNSQYHLIRPVGSGERIFLYCAFDRAQTNLALARRRIAQIAEDSPGLRRIWHWPGVIARP